MSSHRIIQGDCIEGLRTLPDASVHCCVTSPPYWGLRDYGHDGQIGLESTPEAYVARMVEVFREVRRVLRDDGTLWLNLGDSYCSQGGERKYGSSDGETGRGDAPGKRLSNVSGFGDGTWDWIESNHTDDWATDEWLAELRAKRAAFLKPKDLVGIPWRVAFALQADGWWLRQDIVWHKPNPMPESVRDRCTKAHEYVFLLTKSERYYYDAEAVSEAVAVSTTARLSQPSLPLQAGSDRVPGKTNGPMKAVGPRFGGNKFGDSDDPKHATKSGNVYQIPDANGRRNRRSVWTVTTKPYSGAHFATMPPDLVEPCILAGCPEGGTVLDPFAGSGTTLAVAAELGRSGIGCELNPEYIELAEQRIAKSKAKMPLFVA
jgi:DNA modification methylase